MKTIVAFIFAKTVCPLLPVHFCHGDGTAYANGAIFIDPTDEDDAGFLRHLKEAHKCSFTNDFPLDLWAILHEIGHYHTYDEFEDDDEELRERLTLGQLNFDSPAVQDRYFNLNSEWAATEWAINYIKQHQTICRLFATIM